MNPLAVMKTTEDDAAMFDGAFVSTGYWMARAGLVAFGDPVLDALVAEGTPFYREHYSVLISTGKDAHFPPKLATGLVEWAIPPTEDNALTDTAWTFESEPPDEEDPARASRIFRHPSGRFVPLASRYFDSFRAFSLFQAEKDKAISVYAGETLVAICMPVKYDDFDVCLRRLTGEKP